MKNSGYVFVKVTFFIAALIAGSIIHAQEQQQILGTAGGKYGIVTVNKGLQKEDTISLHLSVQWVDENLKPVKDSSSLIILGKNDLRISHYDYVKYDLFRNRNFIGFDKSADLKFKIDDNIKTDTLYILLGFNFLDKSSTADYNEKEDFLLAQPRALTVSYIIDRSLLARKIVVPPAIQMILPIFEEGEIVKSEDSDMDVAIKVTDESGISSVTINSVEAKAISEGIYRSRIELVPGENTVSVVALDNEGGIAHKDFIVDYTRKIVAPPSIKFIYPVLNADNTASSQKGTLEVEVEVTDESGINLVTVNSKDAIAFKDNIYKSNVDLAPGDNIIYVMAVDNDGSITEKEISVHCADYSIAADFLLKGGKYYALIIAIENYRDPNINDLDNAIEDAQELYKTLLEQYTFDKENMEMLVDPTREEMIIKLDILAKTVTPKDNLLIFYAGHGHLDKNSEIGYWLPADAKASNTANWFRNSTVRDYISSINSNHTLLIADACFTGSIFKTRRAFTSSAVAIEKLYSLPSRKAMTSGTLEEVPDKSVFIEYLIKRLKENQEIYLSSESLFTSFRTAVMNNSPNLPQYGEINNTGDEGGEFIFIRKKAPEAGY
jgi:hypothetical protein